MSTPAEPVVARVERILPAPPPVVYDEWLDVDSLAEWMCPRPARPTHISLEAWVGGQLRIDIDDQGFQQTITGEFVELERPNLLRFTWSASSWGPSTPSSVVTVRLEAHGRDRTLMTIVHELIPPEVVGQYENGWGRIALQLDDALGRDAGRSGLPAWLEQVVAAHERWRSRWGSFESHPSLTLLDSEVAGALAELAERLEDNYPFFHPRYAGQMLKPPHPAAAAGYLAAMLVNPNNHALDGGPATAAMEKEVVRDLAAMFGFGEHLGHLTTSGTIANLEALFVARESHPGRGIAHSSEAHYTHRRMAHLLGLEAHEVPVDGRGRIDLDAVEQLVRTGLVGTVVLTAGSTALGAVDQIDEALALRERYGVRVHVDAAYGGFFTLLAGDGGELPPAPWQAIARCDSVVVDPHKHGLQPYGCGAVLFADPSVGRFYRHDSPYTYFTSEELHLGEISLECSRAGAAAAALWLTLRLLPLTADGLGGVLRPGLRAARRWAELIEASDELVLYQQPELDIVTYFPAAAAAGEIDRRSAAVMASGMESGEFFLSTLAVSGAHMQVRHPGVVADHDPVRVLRSVLMKPEAESYLDTLHEAVTRAVSSL